MNTIVPQEVLDEVFVIVVNSKQNETSTLECPFSIQQNSETNYNFSIKLNKNENYEKIDNYLKEKAGICLHEDLNNFDFKVESYPKMDNALPPRLLARYMELLLSRIFF